MATHRAASKAISTYKTPLRQLRKSAILKENINVKD